MNIKKIALFKFLVMCELYSLQWLIIICLYARREDFIPILALYIKGELCSKAVAVYVTTAFLPLDLT